MTLLQTYFGKATDSSLLNVIGKLKEVTKRVKQTLSSLETPTESHWQQLEADLTSISSTLSGGISEFEFLHSGIISCLTKLLNAPGATQRKRLELFANVFMARSNAFSLLVPLLQKTISLEDCFPIFTTSTTLNFNAVRSLMNELSIHLKPGISHSSLRLISCFKCVSLS